MVFWQIIKMNSLCFLSKLRWLIVSLAGEYPAVNSLTVPNNSPLKYCPCISPPKPFLSGVISTWWFPSNMLATETNKKLDLYRQPHSELKRNQTVVTQNNELEGAFHWALLLFFLPNESFYNQRIHICVVCVYSFSSTEGISAGHHARCKGSSVTHSRVVSRVPALWGSLLGVTCQLWLQATLWSLPKSKFFIPWLLDL